MRSGFLRLGVCLFALTSFACRPVVADDHIIGKQDGKDIVTIRVSEAQASKQGIPIFTGVSGANSGAKALSMLKVVIPPGAQAKAHIHKGYETAVYLLQGNVETRYGEGLAKSIVNKAGDFIYIPPNVPHQPRNLSTTEPAIAVIARTDPNEQESVEPYRVQDGKEQKK